MATRAKMRNRAERRDRVRAHTADEINERIDREMAMRLHYYAVEGEDAINQRLAELEDELDIEQVLEANAASLSLIGAAFGMVFNRKWLLLPIGVSAFLLQHSVKGWCPPIPIMRRLGIRSREEIDREKYALMALRGDFGETETDESPREQTSRILERVRQETG